MSFKKILLSISLGLILGSVSCQGKLFASETVTPDMLPDSAAEAVVLENIPIPIGHGYRYGPIEVYFTDPADPNAEQKNGGLDEILSNAIDETRLSIDIAIYNISLRAVRNALIRAQHRGVVIRMVMESDNIENSVPQDLLEAGIPILGDRREGLMHNKFMVIDGAEVWVGSMNYTVYGTYIDNNNLLCIRSTRMADLYTAEFEEMYLYDQFGPDSISGSLNHRFSLEGIPLEVYFSPDDQVAERIVGIVSGAEERIDFLAFSFTSDDIAAALLERYEAGVDVTGVFDDSQVGSNAGTEFDKLAQAGLDVRMDGISGQMHHKTMIIDGETVITGSYNFSASAEERNDENLVVIYSKEIAGKYLEEFNRIFQQSQTP
ncbi:MAG: DUF1669 domain-containing protein [Anaerolineales bacterium]|nr:DUF1669 domain-containing protein [Anaerolineales bacterium]